MACLGTSAIKVSPYIQPPGGLISQSWKSHEEVREMMRYLLLLSESDVASDSRAICIHAGGGNSTAQSTDPASSNLAKKVILELLHPMLEEYLQISETWDRRGGDGSNHISAERMRALATLTIVAAMLIPHLSSVNSNLPKSMETVLFQLVGNTLRALTSAEQNQDLLELYLASLAAYVPRISTADIESLHRENPALLQLLASFSEALQERQGQRSRNNTDSMDLDDEFESQASERSQGVASSILTPIRCPTTP